MKWIFKYLRGTSTVCLNFGNVKPMLDGYTDVDLADNIDFKKSTSGYLITFSRGPAS